MGAWGWVRRMTLGSATEGEMVRGGVHSDLCLGPQGGLPQEGPGNGEAAQRPAPTLS